MAAIANWTFRGVALNSGNTKITDLSGMFGLPALRGSNWIAQNATGEQFVPKLHGGRDVMIGIEVLDQPLNSAQALLDTIATWAANRAQGNLVYTDSAAATRTGQAECTSWMPVPEPAGLIFKGIATFHLADPWFYGPTVSGSVVPNGVVAFGTPVASAFSGPRTTWAAALTGVTSGQPIIVCHLQTVGSSGVALTSIADTFAGHYTWTRVDGNATYDDAEIYIGTGGTGTSGTVTVTAPSGYIGGIAIPMLGASTGVGLAAIDAHGAGSVGVSGNISLSLTASATGEGVVVAVSGYQFSNVSPSSPPPTGTTFVPYSGYNAGLASAYLYPANGVGVAYGFSGVLYQAGIVGAIVKGSGPPSTLSVTNPGSVLAEHLTLDILGPILNPTITNTTNGTSVTINTTVAGTKHLLVDAYAMTALNDGSNVIGSVVHSGATTFLTLNPGVNVLQISGASCTGSTLVTVAFAPGYV